MLGNNLCHIRLVGGLDRLGWFKLWQRDELVISVTVADVRGQFQMQGVGRL